MFRKKIVGWVFLLPSFIGVSVFYLIPYVFMIYMSFFSGLKDPEFVGVANYTSLLGNGAFQLAMQNTLFFSVVSGPIIILLSLLLALKLNKPIRYGEQLKSGFILPLVIPTASIILFFEIMFNYRGLINGIVDKFGVAPLNFFNSNLSLLVITVIFIWKNIGYNMILFLAGLKSIPKDYYEAAYIDGASKWQVFWNITFIYLLPTTFFVVVISLINTFKIFKVNYLLFGQYPHDKIYMIQHYLNNMFDKLEYTKLITASILFSMIIIVMMALMLHVQRKLFEVE